MMRRTLLLGSLAWPGAAQQVLYQPLPPTGSAYLRIVNATAELLIIRANTIGHVSLGTDPLQRASPYAVQEAVADRPVELAFTAGSARGDMTLLVEPGSFNTLIVVTDGAALRTMPVVDQTQFNQTRARLTFYNATTGCAAAGLVLDPDGQSVFADVQQGTARMRSVNPVSAQVRVACGASRSAPFALGALEAGGQYSVWMMMVSGQPIGFVTRDTITPWRP